MVDMDDKMQDAKQKARELRDKAMQKKGEVQGRMKQAKQDREDEDNKE